jgi:hypothetical protein
MGTVYILPVDILVNWFADGGAIYTSGSIFLTWTPRLFLKHSLSFLIMAQIFGL